MALLASEAFEKLRARFTQLGPCERCESILALCPREWFESGCSYVIKTWGRDGSPGGPFFSLLMILTY